jgi:hypothetical protein
MTPKKPTHSKINDRLPERLSQYLAQTDSADRELLEAIFQTALLEAKNEVEVIDLWDESSLPVTFWILLLTGVNQEEEMQIAQALLSWKAFFSKHSARVLCIQSSERNEFRCCTSSFDIVNCPTLIFGDSPDMQSIIKIEPELLLTLVNQKGGIQRFLTKIHSIIENGGTLSDVESMLLSEKFWATLKLVYNEVRNLVSFSIKKDI